jgi:hypothetical protein
MKFNVTASRPVATFTSDRWFDKRRIGKRVILLRMWIRKPRVTDDAAIYNSSLKMFVAF